MSRQWHSESGSFIDESSTNENLTNDGTLLDGTSFDESSSSDLAVGTSAGETSFVVRSNTSVKQYHTTSELFLDEETDPLANTPYANTWYVRPNTSHNTVRDGTSYANAWGGWSEIYWGFGDNSFGPKDTLYICGSHTYSSTLRIGNHGAANDAERVVIRGDYANDAGSITANAGVSGTILLNIDRSWTTIRNIKFYNISLIGIHPGAYIQNSANAHNCYYLNNEFYGNGNSAIVFGGTANNSISNTLISNNIFTGLFRRRSISQEPFSSPNIAAICLYVSGNSTFCNVSNVAIHNNIFRDIIAEHSVISFKTESSVSPNSMMQDIICEYNMFSNVYGRPMEFVVGRANTDGPLGVGLIIRHNTINNSYLSNGSSIGGNIVQGFKYSPILGIPSISYNTMNSIQGYSGAINTLYGEYDIHHNDISNVTTTTTGGCGVLVGQGTTDTSVRMNEFRLIHGKSGIADSGAVVMLLDAQRIRIYDNTSDNCKMGIYVGNSQTYTQSGSIYHNTFVKCNEIGIHIIDPADEANISFYNNILTTTNVSAIPVRNDGTAWNNEFYNTFYNFGAGVGHSLGTGTTTNDPGFIDSYYRIANTSNAYANGTTVKFGVDREGKQFWSPPSKGSYEVLRFRGTQSNTRTKRTSTVELTQARQTRSGIS